MNNYEDELYHHGILGQKWGVRRYQNPDGTLTEAGRKRYGKLVGGDAKKLTTLELASIRRAEEKVQSMNSKKRAKFRKQNPKVLTEHGTAYALGTRTDTEPQLKKLSQAQNVWRKELDAYNKQKQIAIDDLYSDKEKFTKAAVAYANRHIAEEGITDTAKKQSYYDFYVQGDGFQDNAEDWYVEQQGIKPSAKLKEAVKNYQSAMEEYTNSLLSGTEGDLGARTAYMELEGAGGSMASSALYLSKFKDEPRVKQAKTVVESYIRNYGTTDIEETMFDYKNWK